MGLRIVSSGTVVASRPNTDWQSCAFPQVCVLPSGRWICGYRVGGTKASTTNQHSLLVHSDDEGKSWNEPVDVFTPPPIHGVFGLFRTVALTSLGGRRVLAVLSWVDGSKPSLPFFNETTEGLLDTRIFLSFSEDDGDTWSQPKLADTAPFLCPTPTTGPALLLGNGDLAIQFELNKAYDDPTPWHHNSVLMFSWDGGQTWPEYALASDDPESRIFYWDQRPAVLSDGRILDVFWTFDREKAVYWNIHARESLDHGRTWSKMWDTGVPGQPAAVVPVSDGLLGMVYVDRSGVPEIKMRVSNDGGRTWPKDSEISIERAQIPNQNCEKSNMQDAWSEMAAFSLGLPATAVAANGDTVVTYYSGPKTDQTDIRWARISV
jgi:hypothetical protein